jgi:hypothetical protein
MSKSVEGLTIDDFKIKLHQSAINHGLNIFITGKIKKSLRIDLKNLNLNVYGKFWSILPKGVDQLVKWYYMPLNLWNYTKKVDQTSINSSDDKFTIEIHLGTKENQFGITHATILKELQNLMQKDHVIELVFSNYRKEEQFSIYTTPSLINGSIQNNASALYHGRVPDDIRSDTDIFKLIRWLFYPILFIVLCWALLLNPDPVTSNVPVLFATSQDKVAFHAKLPPYPKTLSLAWDVSKLEDAIRDLERQNKTEEIKPFLDEIGTLLERDDITLEEVHQIRHRISQVESEKSFTQRVYGMFTFVNFMWLLAIVGIAVSIGPCIYSLLEPLQQALWELAKLIWTEIILRFHGWGVWEICAHAVTSMLVIEGFRFNAESGFYVSLTGMALALPTYAYSFTLHSPYKPQDIKVFNTFYICSFLLPLAIHYNSSLLSWIIVIGYYSCIGFSFICCGLCYFIGFTDKDALIRVSVNSVILQIIFIGTKLMGITVPAIKLFQTPIITFSSILLNLGLLILTNHYYGCVETRNGRRLSYMEKQTIMVIQLFACIFIGTVYGIPGLANTGFVFFVLYCIEKYVEMHLVCEWNGWVLVFASSVVLYYSALYLHRNPEFIISLFVYE